MPDLLSIMTRWWKVIAGLTLISTAIAWVILALQPRHYLSVTTALPTNSLTLDKARIFNNNVEHLYPSIGTPDELDRFMGSATLRSLYADLSKEYNLADHYKLTGKNAPLNAAEKFMHYVKVVRSEYDELKVKVWDEDPQMAASLANAFLNKLQKLHQQLQNQSNALVLQNLKASVDSIKKQISTTDSSVQLISSEFSSLEMKGLQEQLYQYQKLIREYQFMITTNPPVLLVLEAGLPADRPDKPKTGQTLAFVIFASLAFGVLLATFLESKKKHV